MKATGRFNHMLIVVLLIAINSCTIKKSDQGDLRTTSFDEGWRFIKDNPSGAEAPTFDDSDWRQIDLPHDWSIEDLPNQTDSVIGPFTKASPDKSRTGYTLGGTAWYRKTFTIEKANSGKIAYLNFDGVYMNSDVWVNGQHVGNHPYGYTSFYYDITKYLNPAGKPNVVAVQVKNEGSTARWYSGSGIYRHTWLTLVNPAHIDMWGVYVKTPTVSETTAEVNITTTLVNSGTENLPVTLQVQIIDPDGAVAGTAETLSELAPGTKKDVNQNVSVTKPALWSLEDPKLYTAKVKVLMNGVESDSVNTSFGIRTLEFSAEKGFLLNGKSVKLAGGCFHDDNGPLGSVTIDRAEERKIEIFKELGYNAIRCSHNPPSPALLEACDRLGILVIDEIFDNWENQKVSADDYSKSFKDWWQKDVELFVVRDRNHPSVIMWSIGNEIREALDTSGLRITHNLTTAVRSFDNTRAITEGFNDFSARSGGSFTRWDNGAPNMELLDVVGYNYMYNRYVRDHEKYPERVMVATEFGPLYSLLNWKAVEDYPYVIGNFAWVMMDYLGEAGVGVSKLVPDVPVPQVGDGQAGFFNRDSWPVFGDFQGDIDLIGDKKARYYHQLVVWRKSPIQMLVHEPVPAGMKETVSQWGWPEEIKSWTWPGHENEKFKVNVYTRSKLVKLELNGKIIGEQAVDGENSITATFEVPYVTGTLTAHSYDANGTETGSETIKTVGKPASIRLVADRTVIKASRNDLSYVTVEILDSEGNLIVNADNILVNFEVSGNGEIAGVGSGSPRDMSSFQQPQKKTWHGKCLAILRPKGKAGKIQLKATAEGLQTGMVEISAN